MEIDVNFKQLALSEFEKQPIVGGGNFEVDSLWEDSRKDGYLYLTDKDFPECLIHATIAHLLDVPLLYKNQRQSGERVVLGNVMYFDYYDDPDSFDEYMDRDDDPEGVIYDSYHHEPNNVIFASYDDTTNTVNYCLLVGKDAETYPSRLVNQIRLDEWNTQQDMSLESAKELIHKLQESDKATIKQFLLEKMGGQQNG